uniref:Uncharacterized protein n=1 Tax=Leviviridae sp. TaxID=2027243 RepID=A0A514D9N2_9VIRU|nr:MAG: hypothetical protein H2RhizoL4958535_000001 [Leviviridae sp.]
MSISSKLNTPRTIAQCVALARKELKLGLISSDDYESILSLAVMRCYEVARRVWMFDLVDYGEIETEADSLKDHLAVVQKHRNSTCFQGGDWDLYLDLQNPGGNIPSQTGWGVL